MLNSQTISVNQIWNAVIVMGVVAIVIMISESAAFASSGGGGGMPWESALTKIQESLTGPVALAISLVAIVAAGAMLVFGGDMQGFMRTCLFLAAVIGLIVASANLLPKLYTTSALIPFI